LTIEQKKFTDIVRLGHKMTAGVLNEGDYIVVYEKLDGANSSFRRNNEDMFPDVDAFSRNNKLDAQNHLRGLYPWVRANIHPEDLESNYIYFGEWLTRHKLDYGINGGQFYLFDIFDTTTGKYLSFDIVATSALLLGLQMAPIFYAGKYKGFEHLQQFVGKSVLGEQGEGIVVKNVSYVDNFGNQLYVKLVSEAFAEMQPQKAPRDPNAQSLETTFIKTYLTPARVEKLLFKLVDEGELREDFDISDMSTIMRHLNFRAYWDIIKEEVMNIPDGFEEKDARKAVGRVIPYFVKDILKQRGGM
jgi:hypothetical protein